MSMERKLKFVELKFSKITPQEAMDLQYKLSVNPATYRVFINGYSKRGMIIFDEEKLPKEKLLEMLSALKPQIIEEKEISIEELVNSSMSWKNVMGEVLSE
ncbi:DUF3213 domain-containing protein [Thermococcus barophilus]|uniref:DUF3213 domain-containing protein n=1 Tax=Thermococcus barophilus TaxID=55802 RepID=A0A0S1XEE3_THEBA|nr:DUF3213 domain-containing protein [Thermococcus barophilus]ALM76186.1 hypothetical protein TBCH5v1_2290 [Thermococcus barophilus]